MATIEMPKSKRLAGNGEVTSRTNKTALVEIPEINFRSVQIKVESKSPLIVHAWSEKAVKMMLDKQMKVACKGRDAKDPLKEFQGSLYRIPNNGGFGIPSPAFKACIVTSANDVQMKMTEIKRAVHVNSFFTKIDAPPLQKASFTEWDTKYEKELKFEHSQGCSMRLDLVRLETGVADLRFRGSWPVWSCTIELEFNEAVISLEQLTNLLNAAGMGGGVCEWRPSSPQCRSGEYGRFTVANQ